MRTGPEFLEHHVLSDGTKIMLRHIRPEDAAELQRSFNRLSPMSRYRRFFGGVVTLNEELLQYLTVVDGWNHVAIVAGMESPDLKSELGLGVARFVRLEHEPTVAEGAVTVVDDIQHRGLGRLLVTILAEAARERGITHFRGEVLDSNVPMRNLLDEVGAVVKREQAGSIVFDVSLEGAEKDPSLRRILRAAASQVAGYVRSLVPPSMPSMSSLESVPDVGDESDSSSTP